MNLFEIALDASSKSIILKALSRNSDLTVKEIYNWVSRFGNKSISFQAVFKVVKSLVADGVLVENNKKYSISISWLNSQKSFLSSVESFLLSSPSKNISNSYSFSSLSSFRDFFISYLSTYLVSDSSISDSSISDLSISDSSILDSPISDSLCSDLSDSICSVSSPSSSSFLSSNSLPSSNSLQSSSAPMQSSFDNSDCDLSFFDDSKNFDSISSDSFSRNDTTSNKGSILNNESNPNLTFPVFFGFTSSIFWRSVFGKNIDFFVSLGNRGFNLLCFNSFEKTNLYLPFFKKANFNIKFCDSYSFFDYFVFGDVVFQISFSKNIKDFLFSDFDISNQDCIGEVQLLIYKNSFFASKIKNYVSSFF